MHYKNGREAKVGDAVFGTDYQGFPLSGVVVRTVPDAKSCNIHVVSTKGMMPAYNSNAFLHAEDALSSGVAVDPPRIPPPLTHQQRVIAEREELQGRLDRLQVFIAENATFRALPEEEQLRMRRQFATMLELSDILRQRIEAFPPPPPLPDPQPAETPAANVPQTAEGARLDAAEEAVAYALHRIREEPAIYWHCGDGTHLFDLLTASQALTRGETQDTIKKQSRPRPDKMQAWRTEKDRQEAVMGHLDEQLRCEKGGDGASDYDQLTIRVGKFRNTGD